MTLFLCVTWLCSYMLLDCVPIWHLSFFLYVTWLCSYMSLDCVHVCHMTLFLNDIKLLLNWEKFQAYCFPHFSPVEPFTVNVTLRERLCQFNVPCWQHQNTIALPLTILEYQARKKSSIIGINSNLKTKPLKIPLESRCQIDNSSG